MESDTKSRLLKMPYGHQMINGVVTSFFYSGFDRTSDPLYHYLPVSNFFFFLMR